MAETLINQETQERSIVLDALRAGNADGLFTALIEAIEADDAQQAEKEARNLFSGDPDNRHRAFEIYNQALQGLTRVNSAFADALTTRAETSAKARLVAYQRFLAVLDFELRKDIDLLIDNMIKADEARFDEAIALARKNLEHCDRISEHIDRLHDHGDLSEEDFHGLKDLIREKREDILRKIEKLEKLKTEHKKLLEHLGEEMKDLSPRIGKLTHEVLHRGKEIVLVNMEINGHGQAHHILYKDDQGGYYIRHPQSGEHITIDTQIAQNAIDSQPGHKLGNNLSTEQIDGYNGAYKSLLEESRTEGLQGIQGNVSELFTKVLESARMVAQTTHALKEDDQRLAALENNIEGMSPEQIKETLTEINAIAARNEERYARLEDTLHSNKTVIEREHGLLEAKIEELEKARAEEKGLLEYKKTLAENLDSYRDRHEQLKVLRGGSVARFFAEYTPFDGQNSANFYIRINEFFGRTSKTVEAWKNAIQTEDGRYVYRNNKDGALYTYDADTGQRIFITDIATVNALYAQAYDKNNPQLFRNETPYSEDPDNSFNDTLTSIKLSAKHITGHFQKQSIAPQQEKIKKLEKEVEGLKTGKSPTFGQKLGALWKSVHNVEKQEPSPEQNAFALAADGQKSALFSPASAAGRPDAPPENAPADRMS